MGPIEPADDGMRKTIHKTVKRLLYNYYIEAINCPPKSKSQYNATIDAQPILQCLYDWSLCQELVVHHVRALFFVCLGGVGSRLRLSNRSRT